MLDIKLKDFYPNKGDETFKIVLKPLSYLDQSEISIFIGKSENSGGPTDNDDKKNHLEFVKLLFDKGVHEIVGFSINGKPEADKNVFLQWAPSDVVTEIVSEIVKSGKPEESEVKN
jgi:hypothetical protein